MIPKPCDTKPTVTVIPAFAGMTTMISFMSRNYVILNNSCLSAPPVPKGRQGDFGHRKKTHTRTPTNPTLHLPEQMREIVAHGQCCGARVEFQVSLIARATDRIGDRTGFDHRSVGDLPELMRGELGQ